MKTETRLIPVTPPPRRLRKRSRPTSLPRSIARRGDFASTHADAKKFQGEVGKRVFDIVVSLLLIVLLSPLMIIVAAAVKVTSRGPILYCQPRLTRGRKVFTIFKFRTMVHGVKRESDPEFTEVDDPRVTHVGRFLRRTRLDELPQLFNVCSGEMSLVGPRPERPEIAYELEEKIFGFSDRLKAKAGLTGLAQVCQGYPDGVSGYRKKLAWDILYIRRQSFLLDLWIAFKTVTVVLTGSGAR